jgi:mannose-6-phosphate isomerase-like protein (cupin superfamily)
LEVQERNVDRAEMLKRIARFSDIKPSPVPLIDAVLPQYRRELLSIIGSGVAEDSEIAPPIAAEGFHVSIVRAAPGIGSALHNHKTVEVFMPLTGRFMFHWGREPGDEVILGPYDLISMPTGVMRGFQNVGGEEGLLLVIVGGDDPGQVEWVDEILDAARSEGFVRGPDGKIVQATSGVSS